MVAVMTDPTPPPLTKDALGLLTPEQVADLLGLKVYTVRQLMRDGKLKYIRFGGSDKNPRYQRVPRAALDEYLASLSPPALEGSA